MFNPARVRHYKLWKLQRAEFWMNRDKFLGMYGK